MGEFKMFGLDGKPLTTNPDVKLKPGQWILHLLYMFDVLGKNDQVFVKEDESHVPPKTPHEQKVALDNSFTTLCNALAQIVGHFISHGVDRNSIHSKIREAIVEGKLPREERWRGEHALHVVYEPEAAKVAIFKSKTTSANVVDEKDEANKDFALLLAALTSMITKLATMGVPLPKLHQTVFDVIDVYLSEGRLEGGKSAKIIVSDVQTDDEATMLSASARVLEATVTQAQNPKAQLKENRAARRKINKNAAKAAAKKKAKK